MPYNPPEDYTFGPGGEVLSYNALGDLDNDLITALWEEDVDFCLKAMSPISDVRKEIKDKSWISAWEELNRLAVYIYVLADKYIDLTRYDRPGVEIINKCFGAFAVQTLRGLEENAQLNIYTLPDLDIGLERFVRSGFFAEKHLKIPSAYLAVVRGYGAKLFKMRTPEVWYKLRGARARAYMRFLGELTEADKDARLLPNGKFVRKEFEFDYNELWGGANEADSALEHADFDVDAAFRAYKEHADMRAAAPVTTHARQIQASGFDFDKPWVGTTPEAEVSAVAVSVRLAADRDESDSESYLDSESDSELDALLEAESQEAESQSQAEPESDEPNALEWEARSTYYGQFSG